MHQLLQDTRDGTLTAAQVSDAPLRSDPAPAARSIPYRPDVDGLRAVAILAVLLFHAECGLRGGYVGVDVFFVISGFLIASIVQREVDAGEFSIVRFWERRVRRLFPALTALCLAVLIAGYVLLLPHDFRELGQSMLAQMLISANIYSWRESGYFAGPSELKPLLHMWSLAVEEQFYLLLPVLLMLPWPRRSRIWVIGALLAASLALSSAWTARAPNAAFFLLPFRAWELLIGVLLAQIRGRVRLTHRIAEWLGIAGLVMIAAACLAFDHETTFPGYAALLPCAGAAAVILSGGQSRATVVDRLLSLRPVVLLGLVSYSLYLWHWPLFAFAKYASVGPVPFVVRLALLFASLGLGWISWSFVEKPFRERRLCATRGSMFVCGGFATAVFLAAGLTIHTQAGMDDRFPRDVLMAAAARRDVNPQRRLRHDVPIEQLRDGLPRLGDPDDRRPPVLAVIGDSHADAVMPLLDTLCRELQIPAVAATRSATIPFFCGDSETSQEKRQFQEIVRRHLQSTRSIEHVLLIGRWAYHKSDVMNSENARRTIDELTALGKKVWILRQVPGQVCDIPRALALCRYWGRDAASIACTLADYEREQSAPDAVFAAVAGPGVNIIDPTPVFFENGAICRLADGSGRPLYADQSHLSTAGALFLRPVFVSAFDEIAADVRPLERAVGDRE